MAANLKAESEFQHISVLRTEVLTSLHIKPDGVYVDCTLGGGGHAVGIAEQLTPAGRLIGIDQDPAAIAAATERLQASSCQLTLVRRNFSCLAEILAELKITAVDGIIFDLGVSSHQLDVAERGFSYMQDAPLDMRMNPSQEFSADDIVNTYSETQLAALIAEYGEERWAKRIAKFIVAQRANDPLVTTGQLVDVIKKAIPAAARKDGPHPAKRTFQALRIEVNQELTILRAAFRAAVNCLRSDGRIAIITFHSLEDRIAKKTLQELAKGCICPPKMPICICGLQPTVKLIGKALVPKPEEVAENPRARSAKLRVAEKIN